MLHADFLRKRSTPGGAARACLSIACVAGACPADALTLHVDTSYDVQGFFSDPLAAATLNAAADFYSRVLTDTLAPIAPGPQAGGVINAWEARLSHPGTGEDPYDPTFNPDGFRIINPSIAADTVVIYAGAYDLSPNFSGGSLGVAGPGGWNASGDAAWFNNLRLRGQAGSATGGGANEFAPYGGRLSVTTDTNWNLDYRVAPAPNENDLYTVILHELAHILGIGTSDSWDTRDINNLFLGNAARAAYTPAGNVGIPLENGGGHWAPFVQSSLFGTAAQSLTPPITQEVALDPDVLRGIRKLPTTLDLAGLDDVGWTLAPLTFGDLDFDQLLTPGDADLITQHFGPTSQPYQQRFDFDADGQVDADDLRLWIQDAALTTPGDTDLDGDLDALDAAALIANYTGVQATGGGAVPSWASGNFDGDGDVDFTDAMTLRLYADASAATLLDAWLANGSNPVPEPHAAVLLLALAAPTIRRARRHATSQPPQ